MIGISVDTLNNYKKLTELVPELQDWVETGMKNSPSDNQKDYYLSYIEVLFNVEQFIKSNLKVREHNKL